MKRFYFALDLKNDKKMIEEYKEHHRNFWPELLEHTRQAGIQSLEIFNVSNRLFMVWETDDDFDMKSESIDNGPLERRSIEWEELMSKYQKPILKDNSKWALMEKIFEL